LGTLITPHLAEEAINSRLVCLPIESLPLMQCVGGTLRENIYAERDQPPFDRVLVDGFAIELAGARPGVASADPAFVVATGAPLPLGCDAVIAIEEVDLLDGEARLKPAVVPTPYQNVHRRGSVSRQGALLLESGTLLRAPEIAVAASAGMARVRVSSQPAVMVISTGDELVEPGDPIDDHQVRRSNAYAVAATLRKRGFARIGDDHVRDDETLLRQRLTLHLTTHEVLVLTGGVSMGRFDLVPRVLLQLGVQQVFHQIAQQPGQPMWFGIGPQGQAIFGLPGAPVSTLVCLIRYVIPAIAAAMGTKREPPERYALAEAVSSATPLTYFLPVTIEHDDWGRPWTHPHPTKGAGDFLSLAETDGFVELPPGPNTYAKGFVTSVYRW
jgi:molybdopterin molybdotransferase